MILYLGSPIAILTQVGNKNNKGFSYMFNRIMDKKICKVADILPSYAYLTFESTLRFFF